ncbi:MAG: hypothetical protein AAF270_07830 [Pseudomonadota bacterium]
MSDETSADASILIIDENRDAATQLKSMIEFLDRPAVVVSDVAQWESVVESHAPGFSAVFLGNALAAKTTKKLLARLQEVLPDTQIVVVEGDEDRA